MEPEEQQVVRMTNEEREEAESPQEIKSQEPKRGSSKIVQISSTFTVLLIAVFVILILERNSGTTINPNCGQGMSCMSRAQASALLGAGGIYNASSTTDLQVLNTYVLNNSGLPGATAHNYTEFWFSGYRVGTASAVEYVLKTTLPSQAYGSIVDKTSNSYHLGNFTKNGTTYSSYADVSSGSMVYSVFSERNDTTGKMVISIVAYKNAEFAEFLLSGGSASLQTIVSTLNSDLP